MARRSFALLHSPSPHGLSKRILMLIQNIIIACLAGSGAAFATLPSKKNAAKSTPWVPHRLPPLHQSTVVASPSAVAVGTVPVGGSQPTASVPMAMAPALKTPPALYEGAVAVGTAKAGNSVCNIFTLAVLAGCHIGMGIFLAASVGGACPGLAAENPGLQRLVLGIMGLPTGLIMTLVCGAELFTGNTALVGAAYMEGKVTARALAKNWVVSYLGNLVGSMLLAYLAFQGGTLGTSPGAVNMAMAKMSLPFGQAFVRGILCNWLVCTAVYMASGCSTMVGKMTAVFFPISAFAAMGLEHSVANMCLLPLAMMRGAPFTLTDMFVKNLIPVTLGNIIGGLVCVMGPLGTTMGKWLKPKE